MLTFTLIFYIVNKYIAKYITIIVLFEMKEVTGHIQVQSVIITKS